MVLLMNSDFENSDRGNVTLLFNSVSYIPLFFTFNKGSKGKYGRNKFKGSEKLFNT